jgi:hypothetical protein
LRQLLLQFVLSVFMLLLAGCPGEPPGSSDGWAFDRDATVDAGDSRDASDTSDTGDALDTSACDECETGQYCSPRGRCEPRRRCHDENHALCPPGHWCDEDDDVCRPSQGKTVGESCEEDYECASGECDVTGEGCVRTCLSEADCPASDEMCDYSTQKDHVICADYYTCRVSCSGQGTCDYDECRPPLCYRTADCPKGDCLLYPGKWGNRDKLGTCNVQRQSLCEGYEFRISEEDPYCRLPIDCWGIYGDVEDPCPEGYECVHDGNTTNSPSATEFCARRVTEGEWSRPD